MRIVFISNFLNHHQLPLSQTLLKMPDIEYYFIATTPVPEERRSLGYSNMNDMYDFVRRTYIEAEKEQCDQLIEQADVVIISENPAQYPLHKNQLVFIYSERVFKKVKGKKPPVLDICRAVKNHTFKGHNYYVLCAGAYVARDFGMVHAYRGRMYKWGYFPAFKPQDLNVLWKNKIDSKIRLLWVGRMLDWKQPIQAIQLAVELKKIGVDYILELIGEGPEQVHIVNMVQKYGLEKRVRLLGSKSFDEVRKYMDNAQIFLFTSNREEGWGAVLNEAMNSCCAIVANREAGAVPFLLHHNENGLIYDGTLEDLIKKTGELVEDEELRYRLGMGAYETVATVWNAQNACSNLIKLSCHLLQGEKYREKTDEPCGFEG